MQVEDCRLAYEGNALVAETSWLRIDFTNEGHVAGDLIRFRIQQGTNEPNYIRDVGTFSPGITIKHKFGQLAGQSVSPLFSGPNIRCGIESVHFVDGSIWTEPHASTP